MSELKPLWEKWIWVLREYHKLNMEGPFGYKERPQIGFLAAAAWKSGGCALEEWASLKKQRAGKADWKQSKGRVDLWFRPRHGEDWIVEAKYARRRLNRGSAVELHRIEQGLERARADVEKASYPRSLAVLFVTYYFEVKKGDPRWQAKDLIAQLREVGEELKSTVDAWAWYAMDPEWFSSGDATPDDEGSFNAAIAMFVLRPGRNLQRRVRG